MLVVVGLVLTTLQAPVAWAQEEKKDAKETGKDEGEDSSRDDRMTDRARVLGDRIKSVQRKMFLKRNRHELGVAAGLSLNDAFYQMFSVSGSYAYHILETVAIEGKFQYFFPPIRTKNYT